MANIVLTLPTPLVDRGMEQALPTTSIGGVLPIGEDNTGNDIFRSMMKFDLSSIPAGSIIVSAALTLTHSEAGNWRSSNTRTMRAYRLYRAFTNLATWNTYDGTNNWGTAGAANTTTDRESPDAGSYTVSTGDADESEITMNLDTTKLQQMLNGGSFTNNGWLFRMDVESDDRQQFHASDTGGASTKRPKLVITYTPPDIGGYVFQSY